MHENEINNYLAVIKVVGVGGGGTNAVNRMIEEGIRGVRFVAINADAQALAISRCRTVKVHIAFRPHARQPGRRHNQVGRKAADESRDDIAEALAGADMVFITAGEGGGTGTGAAPIIVADIAMNEGCALTVAIVASPFTFGACKRRRPPRRALRPCPTASILSSSSLTISSSTSLRRRPPCWRPSPTPMGSFPRAPRALPT